MCVLDTEKRCMWTALCYEGGQKERNLQAQAVQMWTGGGVVRENPGATVKLLRRKGGGKAIRGVRRGVQGAPSPVGCLACGGG